MIGYGACYCNAAEEDGGACTYSSKVFRMTFMILAVCLIIPLLGAIVLLECPIDPQPLSFKEPPLLTGALEPNIKLRQAERIFENQIVGPESIASIGGTREDELTCGRPLGIRAGPNNTLFVADAYYGIYEIDSVTAQPNRTRIRIERGKAALQRGGAARSSGSKQVRYKAVSPITRYYVSGLMKGGADIFVENMPGFPDNIRLSSSGGYWVAMSAVRPNPGFSMVDFISEKPWIKRVIFKLLSQETVMKFVPKYSLVIELGETGSYRRSFHDPNGMVRGKLQVSAELISRGDYDGVPELQKSSSMYRTGASDPIVA
ncbi:Adipocyte plasma membrane-associated protein [Chelonia mydas]|uniref:Adipocyte plasma membrane-associated protein n=1 Tax=Chelonia mydas TaxID=8469 RepID=M7BLF9_CHEMY|nr:Adipocyte plasma membrane-associated protein [Chelonia mydas]